MTHYNFDRIIGGIRQSQELVARDGSESYERVRPVLRKMAVQLRDAARLMEMQAK